MGAVGTRYESTAGARRWDKDVKKVNKQLKFILLDPPYFLDE